MREIDDLKGGSDSLRRQPDDPPDDDGGNRWLALSIAEMMSRSLHHGLSHWALDQWVDDVLRPWADGFTDAMPKPPDCPTRGDWDCSPGLCDGLPEICEHQAPRRLSH